MKALGPGRNPVRKKMSEFPFPFRRVYRLRPTDHRGDDSVSRLWVSAGGADRTVLVPHAFGLGYFVAPTRGEVRAIDGEGFHAETLGLLPSLWARLQLLLFFKKKKYLKYDEFSLFSYGPKPRRKRFTTFNQHMFQPCLSG